MNINTQVPVGVLGASGYVGQELLRLLAGHPSASVAFATAESAAGACAPSAGTSASPASVGTSFSNMGGKANPGLALRARVNIFP